MFSQAYSIQFTGHYLGQDYSLQSYQNEYRNLMVLLKDKICPEDFGQCGGMGRCGTCLVNIPGLPVNDSESFKNERYRLLKMGIINPCTRLSCQLQINNDLEDLEVELFDNVYY